MTFIRNPVPGKVKTRLANAIGDDKALRYYQKLLCITRTVSEAVEADKWIWYSDYIDDADKWEPSVFSKKLQQGKSLGARMQFAFEEAFAAGYKEVLIIGSDCPDITPEIIEEAFTTLHLADAVIGPARDGGYYLLGMKELLPVFTGVDWSTDKVLVQTTTHLKKHALTFRILKELTDLDTVEDLKLFPEL